MRRSTIRIGTALRSRLMMLSGLRKLSAPKQADLVQLHHAEDDHDQAPARRRYNSCLMFDRIVAERSNCMSK